MLRRMGVEDRIRELGYRPTDQVRIVSSWGDVVRAGLPAYGKAPARTYVVPRRELDPLLVRAARDAGATVREGVRALKAERLADGHLVHAVDADGRPLSFRARVVVAADGSRGSFSRTVLPKGCLKPRAVAMRAYMEGVEGLSQDQVFFLDRYLLPGYGWAFPSGRPGGPVNVGMGLVTSSLRRRPEGLRALFDWFTGPASSAWPHLRRARLVTEPVSFPLQMNYPQGRRRVGSMLFAGDAANLVDSLTGEGIAYALESGQIAADAIGAFLRSGTESELATYEATLDATLRREFLCGYLLWHVLCQEWGNGLMVRLLRRDARLAQGAMGVLTNSVPIPWLVSSGLWRKLLSPGLVARVAARSEPASD